MNPFKAANGNHLTIALFYELDGTDKTGVMYTLKDDDYMGYPSLYRLYLECNDPTEFIFAKTHLDGYAHWQKLCNAPWFKSYLLKYRKALELQLKANAFQNIRIIAEDPKAQARFAANKFLLEGGWQDKSAGRPSKEKIKQAAEELFNLDKHEEAILKDLRN